MINKTFTRSVLASAVSFALLGSYDALAKDVAFDPVELPVAADTLTVSDSVTVNGKQQDIGFTELFRTGDTDDGETYGLMKDYNGDPAFADDGVTPYICSGNTPGVEGSGTDNNAILQKNGKIYLISQFECQTGGMYMAELSQAKDGSLTPVPGTLKFIDQSREWGGWVHCAGSVTPWNSYLGGEEYEPNAANLVGYAAGDAGIDAAYDDKVRSYFLGDYSLPSPYQNGWITEVDIKHGTPSFTKHYAMGRFSHELGYVMPDGKTAYLTDDGTNETLFMFVADQPEDLSSGTLYAAYWDQTSAEDAGYANLKWINLGHANEASVRAAIMDKTVFSDLFELDGTGCTSIKANNVAECIKLKEGVDMAVASRLESRRYAALLGATHEFRKMEGFTFDPKRNRGYIAISDVAKGMLDGGAGEATGNHIRIAQRDSCGAIYSLDMTSGVNDMDGNPINSGFVAVNMNTLLASGTDLGKEGAEQCATQNGVMAQPDNITMLPNSDVLVIGEDGDHANNMVWAYNLESGDLTRIVTVPEGAETTSPYFHKVGKFNYMTLVAQHPDPSAGNPDGDTITGYVGPMTLLGNN